jgi:hypothetical protein
MLLFPLCDVLPPLEAILLLVSASIEANPRPEEELLLPGLVGEPVRLPEPLEVLPMPDDLSSEEPDLEAENPLSEDDIPLWDQPPVPRPERWLDDPLIPEPRLPSQSS